MENESQGYIYFECENKWMNEAQVAMTHRLSVTLGPQGLFICVFSALLLLAAATMFRYLSICS